MSEYPETALDRKVKIWVLSTCCPDEPEPCLPTVYATEAEAEAGLDLMMRAEWESNTPEDKETCEPLPYPGDAAEAQEALSKWLGEKWGRWEITEHSVDMDKLLAPEGGDAL